MFKFLLLSFLISELFIFLCQIFRLFFDFLLEGSFFFLYLGLNFLLLLLKLLIPNLKPIDPAPVVFFKLRFQLENTIFELLCKLGSLEFMHCLAGCEILGQSLDFELAVRESDLQFLFIEHFDLPPSRLVRLIPSPTDRPLVAGFGLVACFGRLSKHLMDVRHPFSTETLHRLLDLRRQGHPRLTGDVGELDGDGLSPVDFVLQFTVLGEEVAVFAV